MILPARRVLASLSVTACGMIVVLLSSMASLQTQTRAEYDSGTLGIVQSLLRLQTTASVMHIGAHPDDEDSALIARLARGDHARVTYLSLNRGEGGQNTIGPELSDALGVVRSEELVQARRLDGGEQLFTRVSDFGFSKTREEAARIWGQDAVLGDMVRAIRAFRPLVVISRFRGTPADGHGHHQLAGYLTPIAIEKAADPSAFPDQLTEGLRPWRAVKLFVSEGFRGDDRPASMLRLDTGMLDPLLGRSYFEIAMAGRSQHRSQHQGALELRGDRTTGLRLLHSNVRVGATDGVFSGIDTTIRGIAPLAGAPIGTLTSVLALIQSTADRAISTFTPLAPSATAPLLVDGLRAVRTAETSTQFLALDRATRSELGFRLHQKERDFEEALVRVTGIAVDALADRETVVPGRSLGVAVRAFFPAAANVTVVGTRLETPPGWAVTRLSGEVPAIAAPGRTMPENARSVDRFQVTVSAEAQPTQPYWLTEPRQGALFVWPLGSPMGPPFGAPPVEALVDVRIAGTVVSLRQPVEFRVLDQIRGELRRRLDVVPAVSVAMREPLVLLATSDRSIARVVTAEAENLTDDRASGMLALHAPSGWSVEPREVPFSVEANGERATTRFRVDVPASAPAGEYRISATAVVGDRTYHQTRQTIAYPHIQTHRLYWPATTTIRVMDLAVPTVRVGYVMGTGDAVAAAIERMGLPVTQLDADALSSSDLSRFDTIVIGIRASEARADFVASHKRLLRWVEDGGALIVQYQQADYVDRRLPPFAARVGGRITDETAEIEILQPTHQAFLAPNRIVASDWDGWVQERSVNNWTGFDPRYAVLLRSHDPGEEFQTGLEVMAPIGRGVYVYSALTWFRQLPAGVPGAYRLFANLLALGEAHRTARLSSRQSQRSEATDSLSDQSATR